MTLEKSPDGKSKATAKQMSRRIALVEDDRLLLSMVANHLERNGFEVVYVGHTYSDAMLCAPLTSPDLVIVDFLLEGGYGTDVGQEVLRCNDNARALLLTSFLVPTEVIPQDGRERWSYLIKGHIADGDALVGAVRAAMGFPVFDPVCYEGFSADGPFLLLTDGQLRLLDCVARGLSNIAIASVLHLSVKSVESQLSAVYRTLQLPHGDDIHQRVAASKLYWNALHRRASRD